MRALIQRVTSARVDVTSKTIGQIDGGLLIFVCAMDGDTPDTGRALAEKISKLRIFTDAAGKMNLSVLDTSCAALVVSQFTLAADTRRGNRPGFSGAASPNVANALYDGFVGDLINLGLTVQTGEFGADMQVHLVNDGPVTIWLDTNNG